MGKNIKKRNFFFMLVKVKCGVIVWENCYVLVKLKMYLIFILVILLFFFYRSIGVGIVYSSIVFISMEIIGCLLVVE